MTYTPPFLTPDQEADLVAFGVPMGKLVAHVTKKWVGFEMLLPHLPKTCASFLDIGCGHGGMAVHLATHYQTAVCNLLDGEVLNSAAQVAGWNVNTPTPWRSAHLAAAVVRAHWNGEIHAFGPDPTLTIPCDLIISNFSWGHHYPIAVYLPLVLRSLSADGVVITDLRKKTDGKILLAKHFRVIEVIEDRPKLDRVRCSGMKR